MGWHPESGFIEWIWAGYNEGMAPYFLALGSQSHPVKEGFFEEWTAPFSKYWRGEGESLSPLRRTLRINMRLYGLTIAASYDATTRAAGFDYFENSCRATYAQRNYAIANPMGWDG
jgi:hypothetical protein